MTKPKMKKASSNEKEKKYVEFILTTSSERSEQFSNESVISRSRLSPETSTHSMPSSRHVSEEYQEEKELQLSPQIESMYNSNEEQTLRKKQEQEEYYKEHLEEEEELEDYKMEKEWNGMYGGATDLYSLAILSTLAEEHKIRQLTLKFEEFVEYIHSTVNHIRRKGLHDALLLLHTAHTQSALESALVASSVMNNNKLIKQKDKNCSENNIHGNANSSICNTINNNNNNYNYNNNKEEMSVLEYNQELSDVSGNWSNKRTTTSPQLNELEEVLITPYDGLRTNVLESVDTDNNTHNNNSSESLYNENVEHSETWRLMQLALCNIDIISVFFEKILQLRIDVRTRMSMATATTLTATTVTGATPSALSFAASNNNNNNSSSSSIVLTRDEALLWSSVRHVNPLEGVEIKDEEQQEEEEKEEEEEEELVSQEAKQSKRRHQKEQLEQQKQTRDAANVKSSVMELRGNQELVNMFRKMRDLVNPTSKEGIVSPIKEEEEESSTLVQEHEEQKETLLPESTYNEKNKYANSTISSKKDKKEQDEEEQEHVVQRMIDKHSCNSNEHNNNTNKVELTNNVDAKNVIYYPPSLPRLTMLQSMTRVTFVEQLYALRLIQGLSIAIPHQRYLIGHSCFLWYATELYECFLQHVEAIACLNRQQEHQIQLERAKLERERQMRWEERQRQRYYTRLQQRREKWQDVQHLRELHSESEILQQEEEEEEEEQQENNVASLESQRSKSVHKSRPSHKQSASLPVSLIRRQVWRNRTPEAASLTLNSSSRQRERLNRKSSITIFNNNNNNNSSNNNSSGNSSSQSSNVSSTRSHTNSARWVSHTRSRSFNVSPTELRSSSFLQKSGLPDKGQVSNNVNRLREVQAEQSTHEREEEEELQEQEEHEYEEEEEEEEEASVKEQCTKYKHFSVKPAQVEVIQALTDAVGALCHYNSYALNKLVNSNTLQSMLHVAYCPMVEEHVRLNIFSTISVLLQELATFRQASELLGHAPESTFSLTLLSSSSSSSSSSFPSYLSPSEEKKTMMTMKSKKMESHDVIFKTNNVNEAHIDKATVNNNKIRDENNVIEVKYIGRKDYKTLRAMLERANIIDVSNSNNNKNNNINYKKETNNNGIGNQAHQQQQQQQQHYHHHYCYCYHYPHNNKNHKSRYEEPCAFTYDSTIAARFETSVKEWCVNHGLVHLFTPLCEFHTHREWELLQQLMEHSYHSNSDNTNNNKKNVENVNSSEMRSQKCYKDNKIRRQAELQRQIQRIRHLREHQQRAFLQAVDGKRANIK